MNSTCEVATFRTCFMRHVRCHDGYQWGGNQPPKLVLGSHVGQPFCAEAKPHQNPTDKYSPGSIQTAERQFADFHDSEIQISECKL